MEERPDFESELRKVKGIVGRQNKRAQSRLLRHEEVLKECCGWETVDHEAKLLQANMYMIKRGVTSIEVEDWQDDNKLRTLQLEPRIEPHIIVSKLFKRAKKLRAGVPHAERQLLKVRDEARRFQSAVDELEKVTDQEALVAFCKKHSIEKEEKGVTPLPPPKRVEQAKPYREFISEAGMQIWVGKSAKENDVLSFQCANGTDWWLHAHNYPGSHVVVRCSKGQEPDSATLADAAELAHRFSKAKDLREGEVTVTQVKFIRSAKGAPGKVYLSSHKAMRIYTNDSRWTRLKDQKAV